MACYLRRKGDVITREIIMTISKLLSAAVAIVALTAAPALAAHRAKHAHRASHSYAAEQQPNAANEIYGWDGHLIGTDPDPNIRTQMLRDQSEGGN
jgi:hypothetical protein